jgi:hypothetical protein
MTDSVASTARPANAFYIWADDKSIYVELSGQHGPYVTIWPRDSTGVAKLLDTLFTKSKEYTGEVYIRPGVVEGYKPKGDFNEAQRERAREILKKMRIT